MPVAPCSGLEACDRLISISPLPGGDPTAKAAPEAYAVEWGLCACGAFTCDRCLAKQRGQCRCGRPLRLFDEAERLRIARGGPRPRVPTPPVVPRVEVPAPGAAAASIGPMLEGVAHQLEAELARGNRDKARAMGGLAATIMATQGQNAPASDVPWLSAFGESFYRWRYFDEGRTYFMGLYELTKRHRRETSDEGERALASALAFQVLAGDVGPTSPSAPAVLAHVTTTFGPGHVLVRDVQTRLGSPSGQPAARAPSSPPPAPPPAPMPGPLPFAAPPPAPYAPPLRPSPPPPPYAAPPAPAPRLPSSPPPRQPSAPPPAHHPYAPAPPRAPSTPPARVRPPTVPPTSRAPSPPPYPSPPPGRAVITTADPSWDESTFRDVQLISDQPRPPPPVAPSVAAYDGPTRRALWMTLAFLDVAFADGAVADRELDAWGKVMARMGLPDVWTRFGPREVYEMLERGVLYDLSTEFARLPTKERNQMAAALVDFMMADGRAEPSEIEAVKRIAKWINVKIAFR